MVFHRETWRRRFAIIIIAILFGVAGEMDYQDKCARARCEQQVTE